MFGSEAGRLDWSTAMAKPQHQTFGKPLIDMRIGARELRRLLNASRHPPGRVPRR